MAAAAAYSKVASDDHDDDDVAADRSVGSNSSGKAGAGAAADNGNDDSGHEDGDAVDGGDGGGVNNGGAAETGNGVDDDGPREHVVKDGETLRGIAASYDTTPSLLAQCNRLSSSAYLFPGKKLKIPPKEKPKPEPTQQQQQQQQQQQKHEKPKVVRLKLEDEYVVPHTYIKLNVKRVTEGQGCIHGSILLTSKYFMFTPNLTDPAVHEFQKELRANFFEIFADEKLAVNLAVFKDLRFERGFGQVMGRDNSVDYSKYLYDPKRKGGAAEGQQPKSAEQSNDQATKDDNSKDEVEYEEDEPDLPNPLYLRVTMGKPIGKKLDRDAPIMSDGEQDLKRHYWFMIVPSKARSLITFVRQTFGESRYGLIDNMAIERTGYEVIREGCKLLESDGGTNRATVKQLSRRMKETFTSVDCDNSSEQIGESRVMRGNERLRIASHLPDALVIGLNWRLAFCLADDGCSLSNVYRKLRDYDGPVVMLVEDAEGNAFGAFLNTPPRMTDKFMGNGQSFVFSLRPRFEVYEWTGENSFFFAGYKDSLMVGCSNGKYAIWVDSNLEKGRSERCSTYDNEPLAGEEGNFTVTNIEFWAFSGET